MKQSMRWLMLVLKHSPKLKLEFTQKILLGTKTRFDRI